MTDFNKDFDMTRGPKEVGEKLGRDRIWGPTETGRNIPSRPSSDHGKTFDIARELAKQLKMRWTS
jgi:hypothetical protein